MNLRQELANLGEAILLALATALIALAVLQEVAAKVAPLPASSELRDSVPPVSGETP